MPKGPQGQKRPADVIGNAVHVMRIATGQIEDKLEPKSPAAVARGRKGGLLGGKARAEALSTTAKKKISRKAAKARWSKTRAETQ
jgi:hypothetical protein